MRYRHTLPVLSLVVTALSLGGCSDTPGEDPGPPRLTHLTVQDDDTSGGRGLAVDVLSPGSPYGCDDSHPCLANQECGSLNGQPLDPARCYDPHSLDVAPPVGIPVTGSGAQLRVVFSKLLDPNIEMVTKDPQTGNLIYTLPAGLVTLTAGGPALDMSAYYDPTGSVLSGVDPVQAPWGPALVLKPRLPLSVATQYRVTVDGSQLRDHKGQSLVDASGKPVGAQASYTFTTEGLFVMQPWNCPSHMCVGAVGTINYPDTSSPAATQTVSTGDAFQFLFNADIDEASAAALQLTDSAGHAVKTEIYIDRGPAHGSCQAHSRTLDVVPVSAPGQPMALAEGDYTLAVTGVMDLATHRTAVTPLTLKLHASASQPPQFPAAGLALPESCPH
jgi:hypothetical protein